MENKTLTPAEVAANHNVAMKANWDARVAGTITAEQFIAQCKELDDAYAIDYQAATVAARKPSVKRCPPCDSRCDGCSDCQGYWRMCCCGAKIELEGAVDDTTVCADCAPPTPGPSEAPQD